MSIDGSIAVEAKASELNMDAELKPEAKITRGHGRAHALQVLLNDDEFSSLTRAAEERGIPVSTLARDLLLRALTRKEIQPTPDARSGRAERLTPIYPDQAP